MPEQLSLFEAEEERSLRKENEELKAELALAKKTISELWDTINNGLWSVCIN